MASKGLEGVVAAQTALSHVYGDEGRLVYAGYEIGDLAENTTFEEVCHLLWFGELPGPAQLGQIRRQLAGSAVVDARVLDLIRAAPKDTHPMTTLRTAVSALALYDRDAEDMSPEANQRKAIRLTGQTITLTAAIDRIRNGRDPVAPRNDLGLAANLLYMLRGEPADELSARIIDVALILHAEHGMNASTFAARVTAGTLSDMHSAVTSAIGTLKGPLHGGANEQVMVMLREIGEPENAAAYVRARLASGGKIMGFGHRVYRTLDPRAPILKRLAEELSQRMGGAKWLQVSERIQQTMREEMERRGKQIYPNVDFFSASVYFTLGIPMDLFTNVFACARMAGWTAHVMEQYSDNRLIRPQSEYVGPQHRRVQPLQERE
ncbi:MAG TPA: citrate synthase [Longimicrobiales bacterium]|nr:citrate synthase [Longimicrobiales bacterium]